MSGVPPLGKEFLTESQEKRHQPVAARQVTDEAVSENLLKRSASMANQATRLQVETASMRPGEQESVLAQEKVKV
jgi:hypothetical protein